MKRIFYILLLPLLLFAGCTEQGNGRLIVRMIDSPGDFEEVNIEILEVKYNRSNDDAESNWETLDATTGTFNLLELTGGAEVLLVDEEIPAGDIKQIRLLLGENNYLVMNGMEYPLKTPSAQQSGLKIKINQNIEADITYSVLLDFDAARSIVSTGSGKYLLKPVIRTVVEAKTGSVKGKIFPAEESVAVYAKFRNNSLATSYASENSADWILKGLEEGTYTIEFDPGDDSAYQSKIIENVEIVKGQVIDLGEFTLDLK